MLDDAVKAGASWDQVGAVRGESAEEVRREYRQWAEEQHDIWGGTGVWEGEPAHRFGMNDADYAEAVRAAGVLTERERLAGEASAPRWPGTARWCARPARRVCRCWTTRSPWSSRMLARTPPGTS